MKNLLIKALLVAVFVCASFRGAEADNHDTSKALQCQPLAVVLAQLDAANAKAYAILEGDDLARAVYFIRSSELEGADRRWTVAMVVQLSDDSLLLAVGNNGQFCFGLKVGPESAPGLLKAIFGVPV